MNVAKGLVINPSKYRQNLIHMQAGNILFLSRSKLSLFETEDAELEKLFETVEKLKPLVSENMDEEYLVLQQATMVLASFNSSFYAI